MPSQISLLPLWGVLVATIGLGLLAAEAGFHLGCRKRRRSEDAHKAPVGEVVGAMLGLLALMLAFTFSLAASRYDTRRTLVLSEANAIGTTWLRAGLLPEPQRSESRQLLREYLEVRLGAVQSGQVQQGIVRSEELQGRLWAAAVSLGEQQPGSIMAGLFIASLNEVIDLHAERVMYGMRSRIPLSIWVALYLVAVLAIGAIGYHAGLMGDLRSFAILPLIVAISAVLLLIADLDRPQEGFFKVGQQSLTDLRPMLDGH